MALEPALNVLVWEDAPEELARRSALGAEPAARLAGIDGLTDAAFVSAG